MTQFQTESFFFLLIKIRESICFRCTHSTTAPAALLYEDREKAEEDVNCWNKSMQTLEEHEDQLHHVVYVRIVLRVCLGTSGLK